MIDTDMHTDLPCPNPYQDLFIYYIKGRIHPRPDVSDESFIGNWEEADDSFLFFKKAADPCVDRLLRNQPALRLQDRFQMTYDEWQGGSLAPIHVGRLKVVPPWHPAAAASQEMTILLDPGVVFGTGTHPTTHDCLAAMQLAFEQQPVNRVLDLGTGTGLLALAAAKLGAPAVLAVDLNRLAVETALRNVRYNRMSSQILVVQGNALNSMDLPGDLMVSNIHYDIMRRMLDQPGFGKHKRFILSGLLRSQAREIEYRLQKGPARILEKWEKEATWFTYYGRTTA